MLTTRAAFLAGVAALLAVNGPVPVVSRAQSADDPLADVADVPSQELRAGDDSDKRYLLVGPNKSVAAPAKGYPLLIVLPGGDGGDGFLPFVKRIFKNALSNDYLVAQPVAVKWTPRQQIVWPTKTNPVDKMKFSTEEFVHAVVDDVAKKHKLDRARIFTLAWSSGGPAAYAVSLRPECGVTGSLIAMSVFNPRFLPPLQGAKGRAYYIYHSESDRICPIRMAGEAKDALADNGAKVQLTTYKGGHGWQASVFKDIQNGIDWLEKNCE
jgi:predicted esterase